LEVRFGIIVVSIEATTNKHDADPERLDETGTGSRLCDPFGVGFLFCVSFPVVSLRSTTG
jgi:hypothetical protein